MRDNNAEMRLVAAVANDETGLLLIMAGEEELAAMGVCGLAVCTVVGIVLVLLSLRCFWASSSARSLASSSS